VAPKLLCGTLGPCGLQAACKPDSVLDDHSSRRRVTAALQQPTRWFRQNGFPHPSIGALRLGAPGRYARRAEECACDPCLFGLAPCGVYHAAFITERPVRSYRTFSPLPAIARGRYVFCCTGRLCALKRKSRTLSGTLPCGVRTFLPLPRLRVGGSDHPAACNAIVTWAGALRTEWELQENQDSGCTGLKPG